MTLGPAMALAADLVRREEGWRADPYLCPAGYPTIGYGHRVPSLAHPRITREEGEALLDADLRHYADAILDDCPHLLAEPPGRLAALVSFVYNVGVGNWQGSTLRKRVMASRWDGAAAQFRRWVYARNPATGKKEPHPGLVARRQREVDVFTRPNIGEAA